MKTLEAPPFTPTAALAPVRGRDGTILGRNTTGDEQRVEVVEHLARYAEEHKAKIVRCLIDWPSGEPTVLEVSFDVEHIEGKPVWIPHAVTEYTPDGGVIPFSEEDRLDRLRADLSEIHEAGML